VGPSRSQVGGTTSHPSASETTYAGHLAVGQRAVREVPQRALPRDRLVDDPRSRDLAEEGGVGGRHDPAVEDELAAHSSSVDGRRSRVPAAEAVRAHAEVAVGVDRVAAERAAGPAGLEHLLGALDERPRAAGVEPDQEHLVGLRLVELLVELSG
jgi:hypothetical protein